MILPPWFTVPLFFFVGSVFGSFGNVLVERLPAGQSLGGRSHCADCGKTLRVWELVPMFSWLALRGKCARCHAHIPAVFTLIEAISGLLFVAALSHVSFDPIAALPVALALWAMLCIALCDIRTRTIPDVLTLVVALCGVILRLHDHTLPLLAVAIGAGFFGMQWIVSRGKWVGTGDILLGGALGVLLGTWSLTLLMIWFAYVLGLVFILALLPFRGLNMNARIAFGPFIVLGAAVSLLWGESILQFIF
jgi:leader peptidase (prepilin peptidase) / N-methyltransferase